MKKRVLSLFLAITLCLSLTPTGALAAEGQPPEQMVTATQEAQIPAPALEEKEEEKTTPAQTGADENASPASPDEKPTENAPAAAEKNTADEEPGKEPAAATGKDEPKADGSLSDDDAAKVQNRLVMAAAAGPDEPTMMGQNEPLALADEEQNAAEGENGEASGTPISEEDTRTEIWCTSRPSSIQRGYDGTADGSTIPINLTFTDGTKTFELEEKTGFTATKTFDSADAGWRTVTVEIELIGDAAAKYKLKEGQEKFTIDGYINKAHPDLTVSLSKAACTVGEKILPLLSVEGAPDGAAVTYYYTPLDSGYSEFEGSNAVPAIDANTAISKPGTYYVYAKTGETKNYEEERSTTVELTVTEPAAASVTRADGTDGGTYKTLPAALDAAQDGDTVKLLADHTTNWSDVEGGEYATLAVVKKTLTLDLNGMTVDYLTVGDVVPDEAGGILESYDGNLTVADSAQGGSCGKIKDLEFVKGSLAIQGGRIGDSLTCDGNSGTVTISGGTVCNATVGDGAIITVTGGTGHAGTWFNDGTLNITDGTFGNVKFLNNGGTIAISGGTFGTITNINGSGSIPLMPLLADNYAFYQGDNAQNSTENTLTNVTVKPHTHSFENGKCGCGVAAIVVDNNNSCYSTLQAALDAAADNATITSVTLGQDLTEDVTFNGSAAGALTLNMNGHKLETTAGVPLTVIGGELIIEGAGQANQNTASNANPFPAISLTGGKLVIKGDLTAQGGYNSSSGRKPAIYATDGELDLQGNVSLNGGLTITGTAKLTNPLTQGTFYVDASETGNAIAITDSEVPGGEVYNKVLELLAKDYAFYRADGSLADAGGPKLRIGTYTIKSHTCSYTHNETNGMAFCNCGRRHAHRDLSEEKSVLVNGICPICGYHCPHNNIGDDGVCTDCHAKMVAKVTVGETTTYTADLADALNKAANGTTITLLADTEISAYVNIYAATATSADQMVVTLDLADHTVTSSYKPIVIGADRNGAASHYGTLKIVGTGNITLDYVTLDTREKGVLDLTGWTGGSISSVTVTKIGKTNEGKLIVDKDAGHIGRLAFAFVNCPSAEITKTKLYGGSYDEITTITNGSGTPSLAGLLPNGYAFKNADGSFAKATASRLSNVTVSACDHGGKEGFDISATTCPYCNAPAVAETALSNGEGGLWRRFADLQTAIDADRDGGAEFKLLTDVTGDYTINGTQNTALDLNGHSIKGTVTVKGTKGDRITTTLSNTENTTTVSIDKVVAYDGAELCGSGKPAVIGTLTLAEGATWKTILNEKALGYKVLNADGTHKWYAQDDVDVNSSQLNNVIINRLPITSKTLNLKVDGKNLTGSSPKVERGTTVQLCASCNASGADVSIYIGETVGNSLPIYRQKKAEYKKIGSTWYYVVDLDANKIGTYDIYFTASKDGYSVTSSHKTLKVTKPNLSNAVITFRNSSNESTYEPYRSTTTAPGFTVTYNGKTLKLGVDYTASGTASSAGVSTQTLTIKAVEGSDYTGSKTAEWRIVPHKAKVEVGDVIKAYDGTTDLPDGKISLVSAAGSAGYQAGLPLPLSEGNGFELTDAKYDSANASETEKNISFTVKLTDTNYTFEDGTTQKAFTLKGSETDKTFKIDKATIDLSHNRFEQTVFNDLAKTYEINLKQFLDTILPADGDIQYGQPRVNMDSAYYTAGGANIENGKLSLSIKKAASSTQGEEIGTVAVEVETTNYQPFTLTIHVIAQDKVVPVMAEGNTVSATDITYGQKLADSTLTVNGTMKDPNTSATVKGTFAWKDGTVKPAANDSYKAEWVFTPAEGYEEYATATGTVTVKVKPAKLTVSVKASRMYYTGEAQIASIIASGQSVDSTPVTFTYSDKVDGNYTSGGPTFTDAGTYTVYYKAEAANHEPATGTFTVTIEPLPISLFSVSSISKTYDGSADVTLTADKLTFISNTAKATIIKLPDTALSFSNAQFTSKQEDGSYLPSPEVGGGKALSFTMTLTSNNYVFEGESGGTVSDVFETDNVNRFTITKAAAPTMQPIELTVINGLAKTYLVNLPALPTLGDNCKYGSINYEACNFDLIGEGGYANSTATITSNDEFQLTVPAVESQTEGSVGTVGVKITTDNYQDMLLTVKVIAKNKIVPVLDGEITATPITFGQILRVSTITGTMKDDGKTVEGTFEWTNPSTKPNKAGDYQAEWTFTPAEGYEEYATATGTVTIKVNKADPTFTAPTAQENLIYTGQEQALIIAGMTDYGTMMQYSLTENGTYSQDIPTGTDAGKYTVWYRVIGDTNHNDTKPASVTVIIGKKPLTITGVTAAPKTYDGTTNADISSVTFDNVTLKRGTDYTVTASFDDAGVGNGKYLTATVNLTEQAAKNYALEQNCFTTTASITKAAAPGSDFHPAVTVINGLAKTYEMVLSNDYLPKLSSPCEYGNVSYSLRGTYLTDGYKDTVQVKVMEENGQYKLKLTVPAVDYNKVSSVGTIDVRVTSDNYQDFYLTIGVKTKNKDVPVPDGTISASDITYGQALNDSKIAGKMKAGGKAIDGTFTWTNGTFKPAAGDYTASWTFTPAEGYEEYATATGIVTVTVNRKAVTVSGITARNKVYDGNTNATLDYSKVTLNGVLENDTLTVTATGTLKSADVGEQKVTISDLTLGGDSATNYVLAESGNQTETTATITAREVTVTITPNGGTYGSVTAAAAVLSGVVDGETVPVTLTYTGNGYNSTSVPTDVDSYTVTASIADNNYILTGETTANFVITPKTVIVSGITAKDKVYDGTTNATLDFSNAKFDGILENDKLTVTAKGVFEKTEAGKWNVAISDLTLGGNSVANYVLAESGNQTETTATITAKQITVSITPNGGTYGETITPATVKANDVVGEDTPTITLTYTGTANDGTAYADTTPPAKAGTYTVTATTTNPNYTLDPDTNTAEFAIAKRPATVTPDNKTKVYEEKDPDLTYAVSGVLDGETLKGITLTRAEGENAGKYAITATADAGANPNYDVTFAEGTLTIEPKSIKGAKVVLGKGLIANGAEQTQTVEKVLLDDKEIPADSYTVAGNTATAPGSHTLTITAKGNYTDSVEQTYAIAPAKAEDAPGEDIAIGSGKVKVDVKSEGAVPPAALLTDKAELLAMLVDSGDITADELAQIADGASVDIVLTVKEANVPDEVKTAMAQAAKDYTIGQYLDISLFKYMTVNGSQQAGVALHTTRDALTISVVVPDALINTNSAVIRTYCIVRNHEGTITVLDAAFDAANKTLTFKTDRFSDYAIAYKDTAVPSSGSNPGSNNSSNDSEAKKNEVAAPTPAPTPASTSKPSTITAMPQTGDTSNPTLYVVLLVASLLGLAVVFVCKKRNDK